MNDPISKNSTLIDKLNSIRSGTSLDNILDNSEAASGGGRDISFLRYLTDNKLLLMSEAVLKRTNVGMGEEYYLDRYKKMAYESDRHFLCRTMIQDELQRMNVTTLSGVEVGNMAILRTNSNYDIVTDDFTAVIDIGLTPARNYFRGLTDLRVRNYMITSYFDDYMDDIVFAVFSRANDDDFINAIKDYAEGFKRYTAEQLPKADESLIISDAATYR